MSVTRAFVENGHKSFTPGLRLCASNHTSKGVGLGDMPKSLLGKVQQPSQNHNWSGKSEQAAERRADHLGQEANTMAGDFTKVGAALAGFADTVDRCCELAKDAIEHVLGFDQVVPLEVSDDLKVSDPHLDLAIAHAMDPERMRQERAQAVTSGQGAIDGYVRQMQDAAAQAAKAIKEAFDHADQAVSDAEALGKRGHDLAKGIADGTIPLPADPHVLHGLWADLSPEEKDAIYARYPDIGNHGGIPFDPPDHRGRDYYNRDHLQKLEEQKQAEIDKLRSEHPGWPIGGAWTDNPGKEWRDWVDRLNGLQHDKDGYQTVRAASAPGQMPPRFLGYVDDKGRAAVSVNNPDKARKNATLVPGTFSDLSTMGEYDQDAFRLYKSTLNQNLDLGPNDVSVTAWLGYDRPMSLVPEAGDPSYARNGAQDLDNFQAGIRASHEGPPSYNTVIGHSYGTTLVGAAATDGHHLDADAVIAVGSPGMFADSAHGLNLDPGAKVFVATAANDPIGISVIANWHGANPVTWPDAYEFDTAPGPQGSSWLGGTDVDAHLGYFNQGNPGLDNMGRIIDGRDESSGVTHAK